MGSLWGVMSVRELARTEIDSTPELPRITISFDSNITNCFGLQLARTLSNSCALSVHIKYPKTWIGGLNFQHKDFRSWIHFPFTRTSDGSKKWQWDGYPLWWFDCYVMCIKTITRHPSQACMSFTWERIWLDMNMLFLLPKNYDLVTTDHTVWIGVKTEDCTLPGGSSF